MFNVTNKKLYKDNQEVVLRGIGGTTTEYLFKGGILSGAFLNFYWNKEPDAQKLPTRGNTVNQPTYVAYNESNGIDELLQIILDSGNSSIIPAFRIPLNLDFYLHDWDNAIGSYSNQGSSAIYQFCIDLLVKHFTGKGIVVILDLHWNAAGDNHEQCYGNCNPSSGCDGYMAIDEAKSLWKDIASKYKDNQNVMFELYNEPMCNDQVLPQDVWLNGGTLAGQDIQYAGMRDMYNAIRKDAGAQNIIIIGGNNWSYNVKYCTAFEDEINPTNTIYNLHPYQGEGQGPEKDIDGFKQASSQLLDIAPLIITEFGQYCLDSSQNNYDEEILKICVDRRISWLPWAWRPPQGEQCNQPDVNDGSNLYNSANHDGKGGDWATLWPKYCVAE